MSVKITRHQDLDVYRKSFEAGRVLFKAYDEIIAILVTMINHPESWVMLSGRKLKRL